jgi:hypothetical protein
VDAAKASVASAQANLTQLESEFKRQADLIAKQVSAQTSYDKALAQRDSAQPDLQSAQSNEQQAEINLGYTNVTAPFDGVVSARRVSIGELVGSGSPPTVLATIVQLDPIYVNFTGSERDVLQVRAALARRGETMANLLGTPVEVGLQTESGYPHKGKLDYVAPTVHPSTGTLAARASLPNGDHALLPGYFVRVRIPSQEQPALLVPEYPDVVPPTVQVTTRYPGASARTLMDTVALPIEQQVNGVENMLYMQSTSTSDGSYTLTVTFAIGTNLDTAQILVQNRVASALSSLPQPVQAQGVTVQKRMTAILLFVTLTSPDNRYDSLYLANYATINLKDELSRLPGVGNVTIFGAGQYSMRVWLDPEKLKARSLDAADVVRALQQQSQEVTAGQVGAPPTPPGVDFQYSIEVHCRLTDVEEFDDVIVKTGNTGEVTRVRDIGSVELGAQTYS